MNIEIKAATIANNRVVTVGERIEINPKDGRFLIAMGKAIEILDLDDVVQEYGPDEVISEEVRVRRRARKP